ncbi:hypothetical protein C8J56DRAFT_1125184 [Mycena floridula]|nr:hypothetical protein C8J56DRAFT_1125184 [Mycena floridula]
MLGQICVIMLLAGLGRCSALSTAVIGTAVAVVPFLLVVLFFVYKNHQGKVRISDVDENPRHTEFTASSQTHILDVYEIPELPGVRQQDHNSEPLNDHPRLSIITARSPEQEGVVPQPMSAGTKRQGMRANNQWLRDQDQGDWTRGIPNSPPPSYREPIQNGYDYPNRKNATRLICSKTSSGTGERSRHPRQVTATDSTIPKHPFLMQCRQPQRVVRSRLGVWEAVSLEMMPLSQVTSTRYNRVVRLCEIG